jgi:hypothetical protein
MSGLKKFWLTLFLITGVFTGLQIFGIIDWAWYWVVSPIWLPWVVIILLGQIQLVRTYVKNQYWK